MSLSRWRPVPTENAAPARQSADADSPDQRAYDRARELNLGVLFSRRNEQEDE